MTTNENEDEYHVKLKSDDDCDNFEVNPSSPKMLLHGDSMMSSENNSSTNSHINVGYGDDGDDDDDSSFTSDDGDEDDDKDGVGGDNLSTTPDFEDHAVQCFRIFVMFVLVAATAAAGVCTYLYIQKDQHEEFVHSVSRKRTRKNREWYPLLVILIFIQYF
jgi:hypothetical protein